jgi:hypothetical protein
VTGNSAISRDPPRMRTAANGFLMLEFGSYDSSLARSITRFIEAELGFASRGPSFSGVDEGIAPDLVKGELVLAAGWDQWAGQYFLSGSVDGDKFLRRIFHAISSGNTFDKDAFLRAG